MFRRNPKPNVPCIIRYVTHKYKKANWTGLKEQLTRAYWDQCFVPDNIDVSLSNWCDLFLSAVDEHIPRYTVSNTCVGMTSDAIRTFDTITDLHKVLTEIRGEPAVNRTTTCKQRFGFWF